MSRKIYENGEVKNISGTVADATLSETSKNPVQNKVVTEKLNQLNSNLANFIITREKSITIESVAGNTNVVEVIRGDVIDGYKCISMSARQSDGSSFLVSNGYDYNLNAVLLCVNIFNHCSYNMGGTITATFVYAKNI